jgi:hypothetical protein
LLIDEFGSFGELETVGEYIFIPFLLKFWVFIKQFHYNFPLDLHNLTISNSFDGGFRYLIIDKIMWINNTANSFNKEEVVKLLFNGPCNNEIYEFYLLVLYLDCCTFGEQTLI